MPAFDQIVPSHMILLPVPGIIAVIAIIKAAVAVTIKVAVTVVCTIPREAVLMTDIAEATPDGDLVHRFFTLLSISSSLLPVTISTSISQKALLPFTQSKQVQIV